MSLTKRGLKQVDLGMNCATKLMTVRKLRSW